MSLVAAEQLDEIDDEDHAADRQQTPPGSKPGSGRRSNGRGSSRSLRIAPGGEAAALRAAGAMQPMLVRAMSLSGRRSCPTFRNSSPAAPPSICYNETAAAAIPARRLRAALRRGIRLWRDLRTTAAARRDINSFLAANFRARPFRSAVPRKSPQRHPLHISLVTCICARRN